MSLANKFKNFFNMSEEEYLDDVDMEDNDVEDDYEESSGSDFGFGRSQKQESNSRSKVVEMRNTSSVSSSGSAKAHVVFEKLDSFRDVGSVADILNEKRIVILNLETCPHDESQRVLDFLTGVAYANNGDIKRVAGRAYIITPYNVPLTGDLLDEMDQSDY